MGSSHGEGRRRLLVADLDAGREIQWLEPKNMPPNDGILRSWADPGLGLDVDATDRMVDRLGRSMGKNLGWVVIRDVGSDDWPLIKDSFMELERRFGGPYTYTEDSVKDMFEDPRSMVLVLERGKELVGFLFGGPIEKPYFSSLEKVPEDPGYGKGNTFYGAGLAVVENHRGHRLSYLLLDRLVEVLESGNFPEDGAYEFFSGRALIDSPPHKFYKRHDASIKIHPGGYERTGKDMAYMIIKLKQGRQD
ncbi:MAG: GNAT family N-acetyltransferase [Candidatus Altiarchaeales archaeon]|nr:GNAT family N-acetyltransferase [Candidatus Altiarchaeales archaeon]MBD3415735.1 GNAT family N-acetyltransferase [Candidatus Altiarchaeales archaeon]